jgi:hypothetical protein
MRLDEKPDEEFNGSALAAAALLLAGALVGVLFALFDFFMRGPSGGVP